MIAVSLLAVVLNVSPLPDRKYAVAVHGAPRTRVTLRAAQTPRGWVASFCTKTLCAPFAYTVHLDARGAAAIELQLVRTDEHAAHRARVSIQAEGAKPVVVTAIR